MTMPATSGVTVRDAYDRDAEAWNAFLDATPESSPLARYEWRRVLESSYQVPTRFMIAERQDGIAGLLAAYESKPALGAQRLYSLRCGLVASDPGASAAILAQIARDRRESNWGDALLTSGWRRLPACEPDIVRATVQLAIGADEDCMWRGLKDKTRNMIRRAEREGVEIVSGLEHVGILVEQYRENMLRLRLPIHARVFFKQIVERLSHCTEILVALYQGKPIASMMLHFGRETACYPFQSAVFCRRNVAPIQLLNWAAMKTCAARGIRILDMGESRRSGSVFQSKVNFGGAPRDIYYYRVGAGAATRSPGAILLGQFARAANFTNTWLARRAPMPLRRRFAEKTMARGRLM